MHVLVIGAAGMVGRKLIERLARDGACNGQTISHVTLHDVIAPASLPKAPFSFTCRTGDFAEEGEAEELIAEKPEIIFHLAAIVSGEAEVEFEKGRSEEHTSELQSRGHLVCRLLLENKNQLTEQDVLYCYIV